MVAGRRRIGFKRQGKTRKRGLGLKKKKNIEGNVKRDVID